MRKTAAFSLVELSIVLVILGLLTGGILAGQSLIHAAELRAVVTEQQRWVTASRSFRDKYFALPGDMTNATKFWDTQVVCNALYNDSLSSDTKTCNGDGNGIVEVNNSVVESESYRFWQHLANAGLIEGRYSGKPDSTSHTDASTGGLNVPRSRLNNALWDAIDAQYWAMVPSYLSNYSFYLLGRSSGGMAEEAAMKAEDAWNLDTKLDDGKPGIGTIFAFDFVGGCASAGITPVAATTTYNLVNSGVTCALGFKF